MKFGPVPVDSAAGATLAHSQTLGGIRYRKGRVLSAGDVAALAAAGVGEVTVAQMEPGDVNENDAARRLGEIAAGDNIRVGIANTGRVNLFAANDGLVDFDPARIEAVNAIDEGITVATMRPCDRVATNQIAATIKIIPFAVAESDLAAAEAQAGNNGGLINLRPFQPHRAALLQTTLPGVQAKVLEKTSTVIGARVSDLGSTLTSDRQSEHDAGAVAAALQEIAANGAEVILIVGASATTDRRDVIPDGIVQAGGRIDHFGMPVDPGNLLVVATLGEIPVLALPGSARSPKIGGNDLVLERLLAKLPVDAAHLRAMGTGGLLKEISTRPLPRAEAAPRQETEAAAAASRRIAGVVLGGGQSRRMGVVNKLLAKVDGKPMIRHAVDTVREAGADPVIVVTGHEAERVRAVLDDADVIFVHNDDYAEGLSTSLRTGIAAVPDTCDGALVALGDMPRLQPAHVERLIDAFSPDAGRAICVPTWQGKRGNPVLWARRFFAEMEQVDGDVGAKHLIGALVELVHEVEMPDSGVLIDVDSPEALAELMRPKQEKV
ncbi:MAG: molybdopterin-binding/glycosyltransferase family 2 protein [Alphaproteobacteria bacterium]|nr:molybdopterin-binding/glycosyltransferase family 2 protein [Alphaproteobacteria bacterium]